MFKRHTEGRPVPLPNVLGPLVVAAPAAQRTAIWRSAQAVLILLASLSLLSVGAAAESSAAESVEPYVPNIVTGDIKAGIEKHIAEQIEAGGGYFRVPFEGEELELKLVRIHVEYLASLAPQRHFACVDMASADGQFYDVDFFLEGDPGEMVVTETTVHKLNGVPYYLWEQNEEEHWERVPVDNASKELMGVLTGKDAFEFRYQATLPEISAPARCWIPLAGSDDFQTVTVKSIGTPCAYETLEDQTHGNQVLYLELGPEHSGQSVEIVYDVVRLEKGAYPGDASEAARYLEPERLVPLDDRFKSEARKVVGGLDDDLQQARALYDYVIDQMSYIKVGVGWGQGDAMHACDVKTGNCTDYHSYFIGLARAVDIPARFAIGVSIPSERDDGGTDGYHCWAEFYAQGKWWPVDLSEGDKFSALSMYYFGHHPANRFEFTRGRDLVVNPAPSTGAINFLAYPLLEVGGEPEKVKTLFLFERTS